MEEFNSPDQLEEIYTLIKESNHKKYRSGSHNSFTLKISTTTTFSKGEGKIVLTRYQDKIIGGPSWGSRREKRLLPLLLGQV